MKNGLIQQPFLHHEAPLRNRNLTVMPAKTPSVLNKLRGDRAPDILFILASSAVAACAALPVGLMFFRVIGPMFREGAERAMGVGAMLWHCALSCLIPAFVIALLIGLWALFKRVGQGRQLNWPFWLIMAWGVSALASMAVSFSIESDPSSPFRLADMDFVPFNIRFALHAFLLFAWYSLMTLIVGAVHVTALEWYFSRMGKGVASLSP